MELYEPLFVPKPVGEDLWLVDGPVVRMSYLWGSFPFPTRMAVVRLGGGDLLLWSPTAPDEGLRSRIDALGRVRHLVSPNKFHYAHIAAWKRAYPEATAWASPGVRERAASQQIDVSCDADLGEECAPAWRLSLAVCPDHHAGISAPALSHFAGTQTEVVKAALPLRGPRYCAIRSTVAVPSSSRRRLKGNPVVVIGVGRRSVDRDNGSR